MPLPSFRNSRSKVRRRRSHHALKPVATNVCTNCNAIVLPHRVCKSCGFFKGRMVKKTGAAEVKKVLDKKLATDEAAPKAPAKKAPRKAAKKSA